jgi:hypothetical protein
LKQIAVVLSAVFVVSAAAFVIASHPVGGIGEKEDEGIVPAPWYVPPEQFSPDANKPVVLDGSVAPNTLVNSRELCSGGRGIVQSETSMAAFGDTVVVAWNDSRGFFCGGTRVTLGWGYSFDGGQTFTDGGTLPGGTTAWSNGDPAVAVGPDGTFYIAGIGRNFGTMSFSRGTVGDNGITWSPAVSAVTGGGTIDKELLAVDQNTGIVYMAYGRSQVIEVIRSEDQGDTWSAPVRLGSGGIGAMPVFGPNGELYVSWLVGWPNPNQRLVVARSDDSGLSFGLPVTVSQVCPVTVPGFNRGQMPAFPSMAVDGSGGDFTGRVYLAFHSQCLTGNGDAYVAWSDDGGQTWSDPVTVNDDGTTGIQFSPTVSVDAAGAVNVAFYDRRENPGTATTNVYFAQSFDGGNTFSKNLRLTDVATNWAATRSDITPNMGDYMFSLTSGTDVLVVWSDGRSGDPDVYFTRVCGGCLARK